MSSILSDLDQAIADLQTVFDAGLLSNLKEQVAHALRGRPRDDYDSYPGLRQRVETFAGLLQDFTALPLQLCRVAALRHCLPECRSNDAFDVLHAFADQIREQENKRLAASLINSARSGRRAP